MVSTLRELKNCLGIKLKVKSADFDDLGAEDDLEGLKQHKGALNIVPAS